MAVQLFASTDATLSGDDVLLPGERANLPIHLAAHGFTTRFFQFAVPATLPAGTYFLIAQMTAVSGFTFGEISGPISVSAIEA